MLVRADDLFVLADALVVLNSDENDEIDALYRQKVAENLEKLYWRVLEAWHEQYYSYKRAYQQRFVSKS